MRRVIVSKEEQYLQAILSGESSDLPEATTIEEMYLRAMATPEIEEGLPVPYTKKVEMLKAILAKIDAGGFGGGGEPEEPIDPYHMIGYDQPELKGKKWFHSASNHVLVVHDNSSNFYRSGDYVSCNGITTLYDYGTGTLTVASANRAPNTPAVKVDDAKKSNADVYYGTDFGNIYRPRDTN
jgi:hypothetical protein